MKSMGPSEQPLHPSATAGVLMLTGYAIRLKVERGHLIVEDGVGSDRRRGRFARVDSGIRRVIVIGHAGSVSLDALRWLQEIGAAFVNLDHEHRIVAISSSQTLNDVRVRRGQALAGTSPTGVEIARRLLTEKVAGQVRVLNRLPHGAGVIAELEEAVHALESADSIEALRFIESRAAAAYWDVWAAFPVRFAGRESANIPRHWRSVGTRRSRLTAGPRHASSPANAIRNYLYGVLEAEARLAALAVGCDPALGIIHVDKVTRDSFACDLMEPIRPLVDDLVFDLLTTKSFVARDFFELRDGHCRLMPSLTAPLGATALRWARALAPLAEEISAQFLELGKATAGRLDSAASAGSKTALPRTPLTGRNRSRTGSSKRGARLPPHVILFRCKACGVDLGKRRREYCDECLPIAADGAKQRARDLLTVRDETGQRDGRSSTIRRTAQARQAKGQSAEARAWEEANGGRPSASIFTREIAPQLRSIAIERLATATGLSRGSCSAVRRGVLVPHPRHWEHFRAVVARVNTDPGPLDLVKPDMKLYHSRIEPMPQSLGRAGIVRATGLSHSYARRLISGWHVPHVRHWAALLVATE